MNPVPDTQCEVPFDVASRRRAKNFRFRAVRQQSTFLATPELGRELPPSGPGVVVRKLKRGCSTYFESISSHYRLAVFAFCVRFSHGLAISTYPLARSRQLVTYFAPGLEQDELDQFDHPNQ